MSSVNSEEVAKFSALADSWWDERGKFRPLHDLNPIRLGFIREKTLERFGVVEGVTALDIGCGGGLVAEPLARQGMKVTGIDAGERNIHAARAHAESSGVPVDYRHMSAEELAAGGKKFKVVLALEVVEHVADLDSFLAACSALLDEGGVLFIATINRTAKSLAFAKIGAEYVLNLLPRGTHDWRKFLKPSEIAAILEKHEVSIREMTGVSYNPFTRGFSLTPDVSVNYMLAAWR